MNGAISQRKVAELGKLSPGHEIPPRSPHGLRGLVCACSVRDKNLWRQAGGKWFQQGKVSAV
jgi:hypothetical protein